MFEANVIILELLDDTHENLKFSLGMARRDGFSARNQPQDMDSEHKPALTQ